MPCALRAEFPLACLVYPIYLWSDLSIPGSPHQVYDTLGQSQPLAAQNSNYLARKKVELAARLDAAEGDAAEHALVLAWGLGQ